MNILKNEKKGVQKHSRGVAFVDFQEHEHALVALRVLNNNPGTLCSTALILCQLFCLPVAIDFVC